MGFIREPRAVNLVKCGSRLVYKIFQFFPVLQNTVLNHVYTQSGRSNPGHDYAAMGRSSISHTQSSLPRCRRAASELVVETGCLEELLSARKHLIITGRRANPGWLKNASHLVK